MRSLPIALLITAGTLTCGRAWPLEAGSEKPRPRTTEVNAPAEVVDFSEPEQRSDAAPTLAEVLEPEKEKLADPELPRADIVADGEISLNCWLLLDGTPSVNPLGETLEMAWTQTSGPRIPAYALGAQKLPDGEKPAPGTVYGRAVWLFLSAPGEYRYVLRVKNKKGWSRPAERKFIVRPSAHPLPADEAHRVTGAGERSVLPGEGWRQIAGPRLELSFAEGASTFRPGRPGLYLFEAPRAGDVPERRGVVVPPGRDPLLGDRRPVARLPRNLIGHPGRPLIINGALSFDPDGAEETQQLKATWKTGEKYRGVELEPLSNLRARFKAARPGIYGITLSVSDGRLSSEPPEPLFIQVVDQHGNERPIGSDGMIEEDLTGLEKEDVRFRKVSLGLWGNLHRAVQLFPSRCGVALRVDSAFAEPHTFEQIPLALEVMDGALMQLVDWIGRQTGSRYRREADRSFWLTTPVSWAREEKLSALAVLVDALYVKPDGSDLMNVLKPAFQKIVTAREGAWLQFDAGRQELHGILPVSAAARLKEICAALRVPEGEGLPPPELPFTREQRLKKTLAEKTVSLSRKSERLDYVMRELSQLTGVAMAFDPRQFPGGVPRIDVEIKDAPVRDAARTLCELGGFDGVSVEPPSGLWFYRGARPYPSSELLWDHAVVRAYDLSKLLLRVAPTAGRPISGETIAFMVERRIYPESWKEPGALVFYHAPTKKLLVMHGPVAHQRVLDFLYDLAERGEWAFGPVEN